MSLIYILISIITIIMFMALKKTNKKENIILWTVLAIITKMCLNIFIAVVFSIVNIKCSLTNLSIVQIILIIAIGIKIIKDKQIQKYYIKIQDIIMIIILLILVIIIGIKQYGIPFNAKYIITDGAVHFLSTTEFYEASHLLTSEESNFLNNFSTFMPGAYVNCGILLKGLSSFISVKDYYTIFALFDLGVLFLSGALFYFIISSKKHKKSEYILAYIFTIIYLIGYALNSTLSGFCYLSLGLDFILSMIILIKYIKDKNDINTILMFLINFGLFFSYYYFAPVVYVGVFIYLLQIWKKKRTKIFKTENIINIFFILILPGLFGIYYMFLKEIFTFNYVMPNDALKIEGEIYSNNISNFIPFIPFVIIYTINLIKKKKIDIKFNILLLEILFIITLLIGKLLGKVSNYYFYKAYYLLWIVTLITAFEGFIFVKRKKKIIAYIFIILYSIGLIFSLIINKPLYIYDIYYYNLSNMNAEYIIKSEYFEIVDYYYKNLEKEKKTVYVAEAYTGGRTKWLYALYKNPLYNFNFQDEDERTILDRWLESKEEQYFIYYKDDFNYEPDFNNTKYEIVLNNSSGAILKKK